MPLYGQVCIGPPGSGKTTYANGMQQYLKLLGRDAWVVNVDPANEGVFETPIPSATDQRQAKREKEEKEGTLPYETLFDVREFVELSSVMEQMGLGPNGGLVYCMEYLEAHVDDIISRIKEKLTDKTYLILDFPGQVELVRTELLVSSYILIILYVFQDTAAGSSFSNIAFRSILIPLVCRISSTKWSKFSTCD